MRACSWRRRGAVLTIGALIVVGPSCEDPVGPPLPNPPQVVDVEMKEYRFVLTPPTDPGRVVLRVRNTGDLSHDLALVAIPDDVPPIREQLAGTTRRQATAIANIRPQSSGSRTAVAVDLPAGRYGIVCFVVDPDGLQHSRKGMAAEFRLRVA